MLGANIRGLIFWINPGVSIVIIGLLFFGIFKITKRVSNLLTVCLGASVKPFTG